MTTKTRYSRLTPIYRLALFTSRRLCSAEVQRLCFKLKNLSLIGFYFSWTNQGASYSLQVKSGLLPGLISVTEVLVKQPCPHAHRPPRLPLACITAAETWWPVGRMSYSGSLETLGVSGRNMLLTASDQVHDLPQATFPGQVLLTF